MSEALVEDEGCGCRTVRHISFNSLAFDVIPVISCRNSQFNCNLLLCQLLGTHGRLKAEAYGAQCATFALYVQPFGGWSVAASR